MAIRQKKYFHFVNVKSPLEFCRIQFFFFKKNVFIFKQKQTSVEPLLLKVPQSSQHIGVLHSGQELSFNDY